MKLGDTGIVRLMTFQHFPLSMRSVIFKLSFDVQAWLGLFACRPEPGRRLTVYPPTEAHTHPNVPQIRTCICISVRVQASC